MADAHDDGASRERDRPYLGGRLVVIYVILPEESLPYLPEGLEEVPDPSRP